MNTKNSIGLGTSAIGRPLYINVRKEVNKEQTIEEFKKESLKVLDYAYASGIRYFDTAPGYGFAEELVRDWIKEKQDSSIQIATKWGYSYVANFDEKAVEHEVKEHSLLKLNEQWEASKEMLPYLKYYQIHSATFETGVLENELILNRLYELKTKHKIKIGITTTGNNQVEVLKKSLAIKVNDEALFEIFQCTYNILDQSVLNLGRQIINEGKRLVLKESLANGRLLPVSNYMNYKPLYAVLELLAKKYQVGVDAVALNFCLQTLPEAIVLSGADKTYYVEQNLKANIFTLSDKELDQLKEFQIDPEVYWDERKQLKWN